MILNAGTISESIECIIRHDEQGGGASHEKQIVKVTNHLTVFPVNNQSFVRLSLEQPIILH